MSPSHHQTMHPKENHLTVSKTTKQNNNITRRDPQQQQNIVRKIPIIFFHFIYMYTVDILSYSGTQTDTDYTTDRDHKDNKKDLLGCKTKDSRHKLFLFLLTRFFQFSYFFNKFLSNFRFSLEILVLESLFSTLFLLHIKHFC